MSGIDHGIRLIHTDGHALIEEDTLIPGAHVLSIGGREQSHVNSSDPNRILYAYLDRMRQGIEAHFQPGAPLTAAHVGAGALTLARAIDAARPGSAHVAIDIEPRLIPYVLDRLPFPGTLTPVAADGRDWAESARDSGTEGFDLIVVDIFTGEEAPAHLACREFYEVLRALLRPSGLLAVNIGDDPPLSFTARQIVALREAFEDESRVVLGTEPEMTGRQVPGNSIALASPGGFAADFEDRWTDRGPYPAFAARGIRLDEAFGL